MSATWRHAISPSSPTVPRRLQDRVCDPLAETTELRPSHKNCVHQSCLILQIVFSNGTSVAIAVDAPAALLRRGGEPQEHPAPIERRLGRSASNRPITVSWWNMLLQCQSQSEPCDTFGNYDLADMLTGSCRRECESSEEQDLHILGSSSLRALIGKVLGLGPSRHRKRSEVRFLAICIDSGLFAESCNESW